MLQVSVSSRQWLPFAVLFTSCVVLGCDSGEAPPKTVPVAGRVTFQGQPLSTGSITFALVDKGAETADVLRRPATGAIKPDGTYSLGTFATGDGAIPGDYQVMVVSYKNDPTDEEIAAGATYESAIPEKFTTARTSQLRATIPEEGPVEINFDLK